MLFPRTGALGVTSRDLDPGILTTLIPASRAGGRLHSTSWIQAALLRRGRGRGLLSRRGRPTGGRAEPLALCASGCGTGRAREEGARGAVPCGGDDVLVALEEARAGEVLDPIAVEGGRGIPVGTLER